MKHKLERSQPLQPPEQKLAQLLHKCDLSEHISALEGFYARAKPLAMMGDSKLHFARINELAAHELRQCAEVCSLQMALAHLSKGGVLHLGECLEFFKIIEHFLYLQRLHLGGAIGEYLDKFQPPLELLELRKFIKNNALNEDADERFRAINQAQSECNEGIRSALANVLRAHNDFAIDSSFHLISGRECLLLRAGFSKVIKGSVLARSQNGGFYVLPDSARAHYARADELARSKEEIYYEYAKLFSQQLAKHLAFCRWMDKEFDLLDAYCARAAFARANDLMLFLPSERFDLKEFCHPALADAKPISVRLDRNVLIITGVNAGGKSMLLKSILAASIMSKYLVPFRAHESSSVQSFKDYFAIIADPQNSANNISTFAGRMRAFSEVFGHKNFLLGVDEIELGTDFEEAAVLFYELICALKDGGKIIITTHHKRLAMLLASKDFVQLLAALYDEVNEKPKYEFLDGIIGKSYAFETASRYGVPHWLIKRASEHFSEQEKSLNEMLNKNLELDAKLKMQLAKANEKEAELAKVLERAKEEAAAAKEAAKARKIQLERDYLAAISEAKKTLDFKELKDKQRQLNAAHAAHLKASAKEPGKAIKVLKIGDKIRYEKTKATIIAIAKNAVTIEANGMKMRVSREAIERCNDAVFERPAPSVKISAQASKGASVKLDLHGLRAAEALERCDKFISDALLAGFSEVVIYHGIGTGALARAVREFLSAHPKVAEFSDAPAKQGGMGAKIVRF